MLSSFMLALFVGSAPLAGAAPPGALAALSDPAPKITSSATSLVPNVPAPPPARQVALDLRNVPLRRALEQLFEGTGRQFAVEPAVPNYPITVHIQKVPIETALRTLLRLAPGVTYRKEGEIYVIGMRTPQAEPPVATISSGTGAVVELELPAGTTNRMQIQGESVIANDGEMQVSGDVRILFGNGMRLQTHGARVTLDKDPSGRITGLRIEAPRR